MSCKCQRPFFSTAIVATDDHVTITLPSVIIKNKQLLDMVITQTIPSTSKPIPVYIVFSGDEYEYPLLTKEGNYIYSDQIKNRKLYIFRYMSDTKLFFNTGFYNLKCTKFIYPALDPTKNPFTDYYNKTKKYKNEEV